MKQLLTILLVTLSLSKGFSQNVGIGNTSPSEKLDVKGNINVTGTIKANGTDGLPNQVLAKNSSGTLEWTNLCNYRHYSTYTANGTFTVPANITIIVAEAWGSGGGGTTMSGGGGGGYIKAVFDVVPGDVLTITVGAGVDGSTASGTTGFSSTITLGTRVATAFGGSGSFSTTSSTVPGRGGYFNGSATMKSFVGEVGESGQTNVVHYEQSGTSTFIEMSSGGKGGNAGNTNYTGGAAYFRAFNITLSSLQRSSSGSAGKEPGGGGGAGYDFVNSSGGRLTGYDSGAGRVVIHY